MSILIKGMEMPTSCGYCPLRHEARDGDECYLGASLTEYQKRPDDCPLVPVLPHGDLIDMDELKEQLEYVAGLEWNQRVGASPGIECAIDMLDDAQAIIPAEEVSGNSGELED